MDMILVGDSMGMVIYGYDGNGSGDHRYVNFSRIARQSVVGRPYTYLIGDMPFGTYHASSPRMRSTITRALMKEGGVDAINLEGGGAVADKIRAIANAGIVVFGHVGLTHRAVLNGWLQGTGQKYTPQQSCY